MPNCTAKNGQPRGYRGPGPHTLGRAALLVASGPNLNTETHEAKSAFLTREFRGRGCLHVGVLQRFVRSVMYHRRARVVRRNSLLLPHRRALTHFGV